MAWQFDPEKDAANRQKHDISLTRAADLADAIVTPDTRRDYGEPRFRAWGYIDDQAYCLAFTYRGEHIRAISLRWAHHDEMDENRTAGPAGEPANRSRRMK